MLDHAEFGRWLEASDDEASVARTLADAGAHNAVVLHSEQASQLILKGLLRGVGNAADAWGHALSELAERAAAATGLELDDGLREQLAVLQRDYMPTRYPDAVTSGTPRGNYTPQDADRALSTFADLRHAVMAAWGQLTAHREGGA